jgi:hypothetical protein
VRRVRLHAGKQDKRLTSPSLSSRSTIAPQSSMTKIDWILGLSCLVIDYLRHRTVAACPLLAAACKAVRPVREVASFAREKVWVSPWERAVSNRV